MVLVQQCTIIYKKGVDCFAVLQCQIWIELVINRPLSPAPFVVVDILRLLSLLFIIKCMWLFDRNKFPDDFSHWVITIEMNCDSWVIRGLQYVRPPTQEGSQLSMTQTQISFQFYEHFILKKEEKRPKQTNFFH